MAKLSKVVRETKKLGYETRYRNRCKLCGRPRGYIRAYGICRLCFREQALAGNLPGVRKASW